MFCGDRDETIDRMISERSKLTQKACKTGHDWAGKVIHWELCKNLKFDRRDKWYMQNPECVQENETHKFLRDFAIQTDHLISARRPDIVIVKKKKKKKKKKKRKREPVE